MKNKKDINFLIEIGTEELPSKELSNISLNFKENTEKLFIEKNITFTKIKEFSSPRRLAILIENINTKRIKTEIKIGPKVNIAYDTNGRLNIIGKKFLTQNKINESEVYKKKINTDYFLSYQKKYSNKFIKKTIIEIIKNSIKNIESIKKMRWNTNKEYFIRPIHWIAAIINNKTLKFKFLNIKSSNYTYGHRYLANQKIQISPENYETVLESHGYVIASHQKRKRRIINQIKIETKKLNSNPFYNEELIVDITNSVELPNVLIGHFKKDFLKIPKEIIISIITKYQKCIPIIKNRKLSNAYLIIINNSTELKEKIINGYNYSINARLYDLTKLYKTEKLLNLKSNKEKLKNLIFHEKLGSIYDKIERIKLLSSKIKISKKNNKYITKAIELFKLDLTTKMVTEIPELAGVIGSYYLKENTNIKNAIYESNKPTNKDDYIPKTSLGTEISLFDKIDTLIGFFSINKDPTSTKDPYALKKITNAIIKIITNSNKEINLENLINASINTYNTENNKIKDKILTFISNRIKLFHKNDIYNQNTIKLYNDYKNINTTYKIINDTNVFFKYISSKELITISKRVNNILTNNKNTNSKSKIKRKLTKLHEEIRLLNFIKTNKKIIHILNKNKLYFESLKKTMEINNLTNVFFEKIMILDKNEQIKINRLNILIEEQNLLNKTIEIHLLQDRNKIN